MTANYAIYPPKHASADVGLHAYDQDCGKRIARAINALNLHVAAVPGLRESSASDECDRAWAEYLALQGKEMMEEVRECIAEANDRVLQALPV